MDNPVDQIENVPAKVTEEPDVRFSFVITFLFDAFQKCGNANFPVVVAAGRIIDYCDEKDLFKDFVEPADIPTFNAFLAGEVQSMPEVVSYIHLPNLTIIF